MILPYHRALDVARETRLAGAKVGTTRPGDRAGVRGPRVARRASGWRTCSTRPRSGRSSSGSLPEKNAAASPRSAPRPGSRSTRSSTQAPGLGRAARAAPRRRHVARPGRPRARRPRPARGRPGHAARHRPRLVPVRDLVVADRRRRLHGRRDRAAPGRRGHRRDEGVRDAGRLRAVPDRADRRDRRGDRGARPRGRDDDRPAAPGRLVRRGLRCATPSRSTASARSC